MTNRDALLSTMTKKQKEAANRYMHPQYLEIELQEIGAKKMDAKEIATEFSKNNKIEYLCKTLQDNKAQPLINIFRKYIHVYLERL